MSQTELKIEGMTCDHCVNAVTRALKDVTGVQSVKVDLKGGKAEIQGDAQDPELIRAVEEEGYQARVAE